MGYVAGGSYGGDGDSSGGYRQTFEDTIFVAGMGPDVSSEQVAEFFGSIGRIKVTLLGCQLDKWLRG